MTLLFCADPAANPSGMLWAVCLGCGEFRVYRKTHWYDQFFQAGSQPPVI
jgi:hypothetical protein